MRDVTRYDNVLLLLILLVEVIDLVRLVTRRPYMTTILRLRPKLQTIFLRDGIFVNEQVNTADGARMAGPLNHGPFTSMEEAQSFIIARSTWWFGLTAHLNKGGSPQTYKQFDFDPGAPPLTIKDLVAK